MCMWNGKQVTEKEWWTLRLQKVIEGGCDIKELELLKTDLEMSNLVGKDCYKVPSVILEIPIYDRDENDNIIEHTVSEVEEELQRISSIDEVGGYCVYDNRWVMTYIPKE